jgi:hypothetical protein
MRSLEHATRHQRPRLVVDCEEVLCFAVDGFGLTLKSIAHTRTHMPTGSLLSRQWSARLLARDAQSSMEEMSPAACINKDKGSECQRRNIRCNSQVKCHTSHVTCYMLHVTCAAAPNFKQLMTTGTP